MATQVAVRPATSHLRWTICALLFFATTKNYIDRQVFSILAPDLQRAIGWNEIQYGYIVTAFQGAYALGLIIVGRLMDRFDMRKGFSLVMTVWNLAAMAHALVFSALGFGFARLALGLGESGNFPASIKAVAEWFPKKERALATGIFNAGANIGAIIAPLTVPWIAIHWGWRWAFILTGVLGFIWVALWLIFYRKPEEHPRISQAELDYIQSDPPEPTTHIGWAHLLPLRQTWAFTIAKFMTDPIWWFYLFWMPKFLNSKFGLTLDKIGLPLVAIYVASDLGSIGGGWISSVLIKRGWSVNAGRKTAMLICAISVVPVMLASQTSMWVSVALVGLAAAGHQGWSANLFTLTSDMFPRRAVASVVGIGGTGGSIGGMLIATLAGFFLQATGSYITLFIVCGSAYLTALAIVQLLVPTLEPIKDV